MDIDLTVLRGLEREKEISFDVLVEAIEQALLMAYHRTEGAQPTSPASSSTARPGTSPCWAPRDRRRGRRARRSGRVRRHPGRASAGSPPRPRSRSSLQRLRDAEDEQIFGEFSGQEGDIVAGVIQQGRDPRNVLVDLGKVEALLPPAEQVPGEKLRARRAAARASSSRCARACAARRSTLSRTHPNLVTKLFALEVPEIADGTVEIAAIAREAGHRTKIAVHVDRARASTPRAPASARWASGSAP